MAKTTGPILAAGGVTIGSRLLLGDHKLEWRVPVATAVAAGMFALLERALPQTAVALAWVALVTVLLVRTDPTQPAPAEQLAAWWNRR